MASGLTALKNMEPTDYLIRGIIKPLQLRFSMAETIATVTEGVTIHDTDPVSSLIFGQALTTAILISPLLEGQERYTLRWEYQGLLKQIVIDIDAEARVRGIISAPHLMTEANLETEIYGDDDGRLAIIRSDSGKIISSGLARAGLLNVIDDTAYFFSTSDQLETEIECEIQLNSNPERPIRQAAGIMLQAMPDCNLERFAEIRQLLHHDEIRHLLTGTMPSEKKLWKVLEKLTGMKFPADNANLIYSFSARPGYQCTCTKEKLRQALLTIGEEELKHIFEHNEKPGIKCEFCGSVYCFDINDFGFQS